jgi:copper chaperone
MPSFNVPDMSCGHCVNAITKAVTSLDPNARIETNLETKMVSIESSANSTALVDVLTEAGYPPA